VNFWNNVGPREARHFGPEDERDLPIGILVGKGARNLMGVREPVVNSTTGINLQ
jgi:hypothetical protein